MLSSTNIGLKYIRSMHLYLSGESGSRNGIKMTEQAHIVTATILQFLPENILERFSWCPWKAFKVDNLILLYKRQRKMKILDVIKVTEELQPRIEKESQSVQKDIFEAVTTLNLYPENRETLKDCGYFMKRTAEKIEDLTIHTDFHGGVDHFDGIFSPAIETRELNDSATQPGLLTRSIFKHMLPFEKCEPLANLRSLSLHYINVRHAADTWTKVIDFKKIEYLHLHDCGGADSLLAQLSKAAHMPRKLKAFELRHVDNNENEALSMLDGFLCLVSGIVELILDLRCVKSLPAAAGIAHQGKTLNLLFVHATATENHPFITLPPPPPGAVAAPDEEHVYSNEDIETICKACLGISQLSLAWPATQITRSPSEDWRHFEFWILKMMPNLITLNISTWPLANVPQHSRPIYETLLQALALRLITIAAYLASLTAADSGIHHPPPGHSVGFAPNWTPTEGNRTPKLRLVAFGGSDKIFDRIDSKTQNIYLRSTYKDAEGKDRLHATPIGWCLKQFVEPESGVLNYTQEAKTRHLPWPPSGNRERSLGWDPDDDDEND